MKITELFSRGELVVTTEVGPPKGCHVEPLVAEAKEYLSNITAVNVTDNQSSVMRLGSLATCKALKDAGLNPIFQLTCRDRNRMALESDLLSAASFGIDNKLENYTKYKLKEIEELAPYLDGADKIFVLACNKCFKEFESVDEPDCEEFVKLVESRGKTVTGSAKVDFLCNRVQTEKKLKDLIPEGTECVFVVSASTWATMWAASWVSWTRMGSGTSPKGFRRSCARRLPACGRT